VEYKNGCWGYGPSVFRCVIIVSGLFKCEGKTKKIIKKKSARWQMKTMLMRIAVDVANEVAAETAANGG